MPASGTTTPVLDHSVTAFIPALNEQDNLLATVSSLMWAAQKVPDLKLEIIIVNDGSTDRTPDIANALAAQYDGIRVIHHATNMGLGASLKDAALIARGEKFVIIPGDNDMSPNLILSLFLNAKRADMVLCFYLNKEFRGRARNSISTLFGLIYMTVFDVVVQYINSPCLYPTARLRELKLISTRFSIAAEITIKLLKTGLTFCEIPGYMQTGLKGSRSLSIRTLAEVLATFCKLFYEIKIEKRQQFSKTPVRQQIFPGVEEVALQEPSTPILLKLNLDT